MTDPAPFLLNFDGRSSQLQAPSSQHSMPVLSLQQLQREQDLAFAADPTLQFLAMDTLEPLPTFSPPQLIEEAGVQLPGSHSGFQFKQMDPPEPTFVGNPDVAMQPPWKPSSLPDFRSPAAPTSSSPTPSMTGKTQAWSSAERAVAPSPSKPNAGFAPFVKSRSQPELRKQQPASFPTSSPSPSPSPLEQNPRISTPMKKAQKAGKVEDVVPQLSTRICNASNDVAYYFARKLKNNVRKASLSFQFLSRFFFSGCSPFLLLFFGLLFSRKSNNCS